MSQEDGDQATAPYHSDDENDDNNNDNVEAEAGIIEKIRLENFMCHDHLELQFGPNVNFVCGVNGSGKSAVLVAITIALGAKASFTNRAGKMTDLIKTGKSYCAVAIRLRNRGVEAYKPDVYGKSIWVERRINREGGSSYKLKDEKEKTVSNKRSELNLILEQFNIQIDNPCNILMQDKAREFLANSSANSKYQFFLEATQLEQMRKDLQFVSEHITLMRSTLERKAKLLPEMENKVREYEQELEDINQLEQMKGHLNELKNMAAWAIVVDKEKELDSVEADLEKLKKDLDKYMGRRGQATNDIDKLKKALEQKTAEATELAKKVEALNAEINNINNTRTGHQREIRAKQAQLQNLDKQKKHAENRLNNVKQAIKQEEDRVYSDTQKEKNERVGRIHELQTELKERQKDEANLNTELRAIEDQQREFERELTQLERDLGEKTNKRRAIDDNIKRVHEQKANRVKVFGTQMPEIIALITKNKDKFSIAPIGPLGLRMSLKDNAWAGAIESATAASLQCFIVNNYQDERMLRELLRKANLQAPQLIVTEFSKSIYDIPVAKMPAKNFRTVLSMIEADHPMVINALIDQNKIEAKILVHDRQQAQNIMFNQRPPNVTECYIPDGSRFFVRNGVEMSDTKKMTSKRLGVDFEEKLNELNNEKHALDGDIQSLKESHSFKKNEEKQIQMKTGKIKKALYNVQKEIAALKSEIQDLENVREEVLPDISELEENKKRIEEEIVKFERERMDIEEAIDSINLKSKPFLTDHDAKTKQTQELLKKSEKVENEITNLHQAITTIQTHLGKYEQAVNKLQQEVQEKEEAKANLEAELEDTTAKAERICDRVEVTKSHAQLDKEIGALERNLEKESRRRRTFQEVSENFVNAKKVFKTTKKTIDRISQFCDHLERAFKVRGKMWVQFRGSIERRCKMLFNQFLSQRGYAGQVDFDHEQKKLEIKVQLEMTRDEAVAQDTRSLSGGERSFSTVSLLLALWEAMESPFRAMDEFDVYMDALNRNLSVKILLQAAKEHGHRQFIFISPHDLGVVKASKRVKIIKMRPPERGFGQRTIDETIGGGRANSGDD